MKTSEMEEAPGLGAIQCGYGSYFRQSPKTGGIAEQ